MRERYTYSVSACVSVINASFPDSAGVRRSRTWEFFRFEDGEGLVYHPYTGELCGLSELSSDIVEMVTGSEVSCGNLFSNLALVWTNCPQGELETEVRRQLKTLLDIGVISALAKEPDTSTSR